MAASRKRSSRCPASPESASSESPTSSRGERLVALYTGEAEASVLTAALQASELPKLWQPKPADLRRLTDLPTQGTGKLDLRRAKAIAAGAG
jgi:acyl-[acyl-carrier-protein]-phospholipid O-acyltransferase/long-chain-fatty-acid--[acyl-carrier-protein] ligase